MEINEIDLAIAGAPSRDGIMGLIHRYALARIAANVSVPSKVQRESATCVAWHDRDEAEVRRLEAEIAAAFTDVLALIRAAEAMREKLYGPAGDDPMPVFVIKAKDRLAPAAIAAYSRLCLDGELDEQRAEVEAALAEVIVWQQLHPDLVKTPSHEHVPAQRRSIDAAVYRYAGNMLAAGLDVTVTQIAPGQTRVSGKVPASQDEGKP